MRTANTIQPLAASTLRDPIASASIQLADEIAPRPARRRLLGSGSHIRLRPRFCSISGITILPINRALPVRIATAATLLSGFGVKLAGKKLVRIWIMTKPVTHIAISTFQITEWQRCKVVGKLSSIGRPSRDIT